jgi:hypothetical protein
MLIPLRHRKRPEDLDAGFVEEVRLGAGFLGIPTYRQALRALHGELRRARRYQHPLSVAALSPAATGSGAHRLDRVRAPHLSFYLLGSLLRDVFRETDVATYAAEHHLFAVFLLETREEDAARAVRRLDALFRGHTGGEVRAGTAEFPRDGLTVEDLFGRAHRAWEERRPGTAAPFAGERVEVKNA